MNIRVFERVQDILVMDRLQLLLNILYDKKVSAGLFEKCLPQLSLLMYYSQSPHIIHLVNKVLQQHGRVKNISLL